MFKLLFSLLVIYALWKIGFFTFIAYTCMMVLTLFFTWIAAI